MKISDIQINCELARVYFMYIYIYIYIYKVNKIGELSRKKKNGSQEGKEKFVERDENVKILTRVGRVDTIIEGRK
jgi:hypothetical protein